MARPRDVAHLLRLISWLMALGVLKHVVTFGRLARWMWRPADDAPRRSREEIAGRVLQAGRWCGAPDRDCVQRSLLLYRELSATGADPVLVLGMAREHDRTTGHAWVEVGGAPITEPAAALARFAPLARFGRAGRLMPDDGPASVASQI